MIRKNDLFYMGKKLGQDAFDNGCSCNPDHDAELNALCEGRSSEEKQSFKVGWLSGWRGELLNTGDW